MSCDDVMRRLTEFLATPGPTADVQAALPKEVEHVASCAHCLEELAVTSTLLTGRRSGLLDAVFARGGCALVEQLIPAWVEKEKSSQPPGAQNPSAWRHMAACERCRRSYAELKELVAAAAAGEYGPLPDEALLAEPGNDLRSLLPRLLQGPAAGECLNTQRGREPLTNPLHHDRHGLLLEKRLLAGERALKHRALRPLWANPGRPGSGRSGR